MQQKLDIEPLAGAGTCETKNPPSTIRGVQNTLGGSGVQLSRGLILDWLSLTFPTESRGQQARVLSMLSATFPDLNQTPYGGRGYTAGASFLGSGRVLWNPERLEMGVHVQMSSRVLVIATELIPDFDAVEVLRVFSDVWGAKATRIDLALDTQQDIVTKALSHCERGDVSTRAKSYDPRFPKKFTPNGEKATEVKGRVVYIGSRSSDTFVRIYDKRLQQGTEEPWYRCEFEFKGDNAKAIDALILAGNYEAIQAAMLSHLDFKMRGVDSNKARRKTAKWWLCLLRDAVKHKLAVGVNVAPSIEQIGDWLERQVGPNLALWWVYCEKSETDLNEWVMSFAARWGPRHKLVLQTI